MIPAFGQVPAPPDWLADLGVATDDGGRIRVDAEGRTSNPRVYAGGDASQGPDLVVTALAAGRRAAAAILADRAPLARLRRAAAPGRRSPSGAGGLGVSVYADPAEPAGGVSAAGPAGAKHDWIGLDLCRAYPERMPPELDSAAFPQPGHRRCPVGEPLL